MIERLRYASLFVLGQHLDVLTTLVGIALFNCYETNRLASSIPLLLFAFTKLIVSFIIGNILIVHNWSSLLAHKLLCTLTLSIVAWNTGQILIEAVSKL